MSLSYPEGAWRIYVVDDASTDDTPAVLQEKMNQYPGSVFHLRREIGGQGKAHALNYGLSVVLNDDWAEAVMIMDADVLFEKNALRTMALHLADSDVGAVTAYIKEAQSAGHDRHTVHCDSNTSWLKRPRRVVPKMSAVFWRVYPAALTA